MQKVLRIKKKSLTAQNPQYFPFSLSMIYSEPHFHHEVYYVFLISLPGEGKDLSIKTVYMTEYILYNPSDQQLKFKE